MRTFKEGDRVYHVEYGWGEVGYTPNINFPLVVAFSEDEVMSFTPDGRETTESKQSLLSFTEYTLKGFSQERPIELPEIGEDVLVYDENSDDWILRQFERYVACSCIPFHVTDRDSFLSIPRGYSKLKRIKILD